MSGQWTPKLICSIGGLPPSAVTLLWGFTVQLNPAIVYFKGLVKIMLYIEVLFIANIKITMKILLGTKIYMLYWRNYVKSGCAIAGFHCSIILQPSLRAPKSPFSVKHFFFSLATSNSK